MFGGQGLPAFLPFLENEIGVNTKNENEKQDDITINLPNVNHAFVEELGT